MYKSRQTLLRAGFSQRDPREDRQTQTGFLTVFWFGEGLPANAGMLHFSVFISDDSNSNIVFIMYVLLVCDNCNND